MYHILEMGSSTQNMTPKGTFSYFVEVMYLTDSDYNDSVSEL